ncbi:MAG: ROK family protein, partial [Pyrinomonadaceae bacterium]
VLHIARAATPNDVSPQQLLDLAAKMAAECRAAIDSSHEICGVAFASPAPAAKNSDGILSKLPNLPSLNGMNLPSGLSDMLGLPVTLENDATAAAIGEHWIGASRGTNNSIVVTLGTGVGGGLIVDGQPFRGIDGTAGEIGHICVEPDGHPCGCGSHGCIEQYASATAIIRMANELGLKVSTAKAVYDAAKSGDGKALAVFESMGRYLGIILAGLINTLNPEIIVIGGGVAAGMDAFADHIEAEISFRAFREPATRVRIVPTKLSDMAGILGVAKSAFDQN